MNTLTATTLTSPQISGYKSRIYSLARMGAKKSAANVKAEALAVVQNVPEVNRQWVADQWYGRCSNTSFEALIAELSN